MQAAELLSWRRCFWAVGHKFCYSSYLVELQRVLTLLLSAYFQQHLGFFWVFSSDSSPVYCICIITAFDGFSVADVQRNRCEMLRLTCLPASWGWFNI